MALWKDLNNKVHDDMNGAGFATDASTNMNCTFTVPPNMAYSFTSGGGTTTHTELR